MTTKSNGLARAAPLAEGGDLSWYTDPSPTPGPAAAAAAGGGDRAAGGGEPDREESGLDTEPTSLLAAANHGGLVVYGARRDHGEEFDKWNGREHQDRIRAHLLANGSRRAEVCASPAERAKAAASPVVERARASPAERARAVLVRAPHQTRREAGRSRTTIPAAAL